MKTIIAPTDFSANADHAVHYAGEFAAAIGASLYLFHVCALPISFGEMPPLVVGLDEMREIAMAEIQELKKTLEADLKGKLKVYTEVRIGAVVPELKKFAAEVNPFAVAMGKHGAGAVERLLFGSNTLAAIRQLSVPLIIVQENAKYKDIKKIGLACDYYKVIDKAPIEAIKNLVKQLGAALSVVYVNKAKTDKFSEKIIEESGNLQEMLDELHPKYDFIDYEDIEEGLGKYAKENKLDLLIVIPRGHGLLGGIFHSSHSKKLVLHTHVPVMAIHD